MLRTAAGFTLILTWMNQCKRDRSVPTLWHVSQICAMFKGKRKDDSLPENVCPIALLNTFYKPYSGLVLHRFEDALLDRISKWQCCFRAGYSVDGAAFSLLRVVELSENLKDFSTYLLLLDWKHAFDQVETVGQEAPLFDALSRLGVPEEWREIVASFYADMVFYVQDGFSLFSN